MINKITHKLNHTTEYHTDTAELGGNVGMPGLGWTTPVDLKSRGAEKEHQADEALRYGVALSPVVGMRCVCWTEWCRLTMMDRIASCAAQ